MRLNIKYLHKWTLDIYTRYLHTKYLHKTRDSEDEAVPLHRAGCLLAGGEGGLHVQRRAAGGSHQQLQGETIYLETVNSVQYLLIIICSLGDSYFTKEGS